MIKTILLSLMRSIISVLGNPKKAPQGDIFYERKAQTYDIVREGSKHRRAERKILKRYLDRIEPVHNILDIPIGTGAFIDLYAPSCEHVIGADISNTMLDFAEKKVPASLVDNFSFKPLDVLDDELTEDAFEVVISIRFLGEVLNLEQLETALPKLVAASKRWLILDLGYARFSILSSTNKNYASQASSRNTIENTLREHGLTILDKKLSKGSLLKKRYIYLCERKP